MKRKLLAGVCVVMFGISGMAYSDDTTVTLDGNTSNSGFSVKDSSGTSIARFQGDGSVGIGTTNPSSGVGYNAKLQLSAARPALIMEGTTALRKYAFGVDSAGNIEIFDETSNASRLFIKASGNVGIGTTNPNGKLDVVSNSISSDTQIASFAAPDSNTGIGFVTYGGGTYGGGFVGWDYSLGGLTINAHAAGGSSGGIFVKRYDNSQSYIGIGTNAPSYTLHVNGSAYSTGGWSGSDERWKKEINPLENSLSNVLKLQGVNYRWKTDEFPKNGFCEGRQIGLIAQEVEKVIPELVHTDKEGYKSVSYEKLAAILIEAVKEQQKQIVQQQEQINTLREKDEKIALLEKKLSELSETMNSAIQFASVK